MVNAKNGDTVLVHYTGKLTDGTTFDSSVDREPLEVHIGAGQIIPGFEQALVGMSPGQVKQESIPCDRAYGPHQPELVLTVNRQVFGDTPIEVGQQLQRTNSTGQVLTLTIIGIEKTKITLDANHVLAGEDLIFEIKLLEIV